MDAGEQPKGEGRRYPRSVAAGRPLGRVNNAYNVSLIDINRIIALTPNDIVSDDAAG